jgi:uncharacterized protein YbcI
MSKQSASTMDRMGHIFSGMVMEEAIKDKEKEFEKGINELNQQKLYQDNEEVKIDEYGAQEKVRKDSLDSDEDFNLDDEGESVLDAIRAKRLNEIKKEAKQIMENKAKGHGEYREISQDEFLPTVTNNKKVV